MCVSNLFYCVQDVVVPVMEVGSVVSTDAIDKPVVPEQQQPSQRAVVPGQPGFIPAPKPHNETERLQMLREMGILDTERESQFDTVTKLLTAVFGVPIALVSLVDADELLSYALACCLPKCVTLSLWGDLGCCPKHISPLLAVFLWVCAVVLWPTVPPHPVTHAFLLLAVVFCTEAVVQSAR
jgi:hypothetical protein